MACSAVLPLSTSWTNVQFSCTPTLTSVNVTLSITCASGTCLWSAVSLLPDDHVNGMRPDVIARLGSLGFQGLLRYPGYKKKKKEKKEKGKENVKRSNKRLHKEDEECRTMKG